VEPSHGRLTRRFALPNGPDAATGAGSAVVIAVSLMMAVTGCTPSHFRVSPERDDPVAARVTVERAAADCAVRRNDTDLPPHPFTSDGCSVWPDGNWADCCRQHDMTYWCGGNAEARQQADAALRACVADHGATCMARVMYVGARAGGIPWQPFPWRWGYGWSGVRGFDDVPP
jgi:hypothetical protein